MVGQRAPHDRELLLTQLVERLSTIRREVIGKDFENLIRDTPRKEVDQDRRAPCTVRSSLQHVARDQHGDRVVRFTAKNSCRVEHRRLVSESPDCLIRISQGDLYQSGLRFIVDPADCLAANHHGLQSDAVPP